MIIIRYDFVIIIQNGFSFCFQNRKLEDKDRQLQKKVSELQTQTQRLERKITLLKTENDTLVSNQLKGVFNI